MRCVSADSKQGRRERRREGEEKEGRRKGELDEPGTSLNARATLAWLPFPTENTSISLLASLQPPPT